MVSFQCEACGDVLTKKKLDPHRNRCRRATFSCIDCMVHFYGTEYRGHTSCMTEAQKYEGALYKTKKAKTSETTSVSVTTPTVAKSILKNKAMAYSAYVEDADDLDWKDYEDKSNDDDRSPADLPPEAPTPPSMVDDHVNVFDYLVNTSTPAASNINLPHDDTNEETQLVRFDTDALLEQLGDMADDEAMVQYGTGPVPTVTFKTPVSKGERKKSKDGDGKEGAKDKKRKRLHVETDQVMTDAPPVLHSGLSSGISKLMTRQHAFPPSPDYSGGDVAETPASPLKKSKHSKHGKGSRDTIGTSLMAMIAPSKTKTKARKSTSAPTAKKARESRHRIEAPKVQKLIEFRDGNDKNQVIVYKPRAEHFLGFVNKGPESERGCSLNKVLKRYHRERKESGQGLAKPLEEKELFRCLRLRKNDRGEIVVFCE